MRMVLSIDLLRIYSRDEDGEIDGEDDRILLYPNNALQPEPTMLYPALRCRPYLEPP